MLRFYVILLVLTSVAPCSSAATQHRVKSHKQHTAPQPATVQPDQAPQEQPALPPPTPEQGPASPPEVTFQGGQLTILAKNSTMGDVLNAVKQKTGALVEMPVASSERVVGRFGPGAPSDVMAQLLNGSHYDYVLVGSPSEPGALKRVVLMARASGPNPAPSQPNPQMANQPLQAVPDVDTDASADENNADATPEIPQPEEEPQGEQPPGQNGAPVVKTPEQLLRELQQQQQQQQQQNIPPGAPGQPPQ